MYVIVTTVIFVTFVIVAVKTTAVSNLPNSSIIPVLSVANKKCSILMEVLPIFGYPIIIRVRSMDRVTDK